MVIKAEKDLQKGEYSSQLKTKLNERQAITKTPNKLIIILVLILALIIIGTGSLLLFSNRKNPTPDALIRSTNNKTQTTNGNINLGQGFSVAETGSKYKIANAQTQGMFKNGQQPDLVLSAKDFNNTGGSLLFNHPAGIASDGTRLYLADRNNNRVLIWNKLPAANVEPDLVLGQENFTTNNSGDSLSKMNWPVGVATDGRHLFVSDAYNNRVLIWNSIPTKNGQSADLALVSTPGGDRNDDSSSVIGWPWGIWTDGRKLAVCSTGTGRVLIWNEIPSQSNQKADIVLRLPGKFVTPRSIGSDGNHLVIGDHNAMNTNRGNFFWNNFPTKNNQMYDFFMLNFQNRDDNFNSQPFNQPNNGGFAVPPPPPPAGDGNNMQPLPPLQNSPLSHFFSHTALAATLPNNPQNGTIFWGPTFTTDGKLFVLGDAVGIWNNFPESGTVPTSLTLGTPQRFDNTEKGEMRYNFNGGDGSGIAMAGKKLYISLANGNKIVGFNNLPQTSDAKPDFAIGATDINADTLGENFIISNPVPASDGNSLFVSSDFDAKLYVWKNLPDESGSKPDLVYSLPEAPWDNELHGQTLALAGKQSVYIWNSLPTTPKLPDVIINKSAGNTRFGEIKGVAFDDKYFYVADQQAQKIYVWRGMPSTNSDPAFSITVDNPTRISSDGKYLVVTTGSNSGGFIKMYDVASLGANAAPIRPGVNGRFNLPETASANNGKLIVADTGFNRTLIWNKIEDAATGKPADVSLGKYGVDMGQMRQEDARPGIDDNKLFWPGAPFWDGNYLWLGEYKFSERLLRFSPQ